MRTSLRLGNIAGIHIGLHWSIAVIAALLTATLTGTVLPATADGYGGVSYLLAGLVTVGLFLASIVAHELGHSLVARNNEVEVRGITLFALGGVAQLEGSPRTPGAAARIALAGPAVSVGVGVVSVILGAVGATIGLSPLAVACVTWLGVINLGLAVFNMLPALPLDGGRVLQAVLWKRSGDPHRATLRAATVGRYVGWTLVALGLWLFSQGGSGVWTALIGWFIISSARAEARQARFQLQRDEQARQWEQWARSFDHRSDRRTPGPSWPTGAPSRSRTGLVIDVDSHEVESTEDVPSSRMRL